MAKKVILLLAILSLFLGNISASSVTRSFSASTIGIGDSLTVTLTVAITGGETYYAIDETLPTDWTVTDSGTSNTDQAGHLKWVVIENGVDTTYTYVLTAPAQAGTGIFSGQYMFEGMTSETTVSGQTGVTAEFSCSLDSECSGQICCNTACVDVFCDLGADCDDGLVSTQDDCSQAGTCTAACENTEITACTDGDGYCPTGCDIGTDNDCLDTCGNASVDAGENCGNCPSDVACSDGFMCSNDTCIEPTCTLDADCNDDDDCTTNTCSNAGTVTAECTYTIIYGCGTSGNETPGSGDTIGGPSIGGGSDGPTITVNIEGSCTNQPIAVTVLNYKGNPMKDTEIRVERDMKTVETKKTGSDGKLSYAFEEPGEYIFYTTKAGYQANIQKIQLRGCAPPTVSLEESLETGQIQTIMLIAENGNSIRDFNVLITYPSNTTVLLQAEDGLVTLQASEAGRYTAIVQTKNFEKTLNFEASASLQVVPNINPDARPVVETVLGEETVDQPNYLIIWILAVAVISGLIIEVTKLKPVWFRIFMAATYTLLPLVVNYYGGNVWIAFTAIGIQTTILTALLFKYRKAKKISKWMESPENNS